MKKLVLGMAVIGLMSAPVMAETTGEKIALASPKGHQAIKAKVVDDTPANYTIDVHSFSNLGVNEEAPTFAVYTASRLPDKCGDFSDTPLSYEKPEKYKRVFDISENPEIITAINEYKCVIVPNKPAQ